MKNKINVVLPLIGALLVLFSSMWKPETTFIVAIGALVLLSIYFLLNKNA
jgi:hypothetical protein